MALVTRDANCSMDASTGMFAPQITGLVCGEDIDAGAPCYIKTSDGKLYMSKGNSKGLTKPGRIAPRPFRDLWGVTAPPGAAVFELGGMRQIARVGTAAELLEHRGVEHAFIADEMIGEASEPALAALVGVVGLLQ